MFGRENILKIFFFNQTGGRGTPYRPIFSTCVEPTLKSTAILMKFTQDVWMDEGISGKKFLFKSDGREGYTHRLIFSTCVEPTLKSDTILMKFTQDVCMDE